MAHMHTIKINMRVPSTCGHLVCWTCGRHVQRIGSSATGAVFTHKADSTCKESK